MLKLWVCRSQLPYSLTVSLESMDPVEPAAALPEVTQDVPDADTLKEVAGRLVRDLDLHQCSIKECRAKVAVACGMEPDGLEARKDEFSALLKEQANRPAVVKSLVLSATSRGELT